jgi:hypothetical protein
MKNRFTVIYTIFAAAVFIFAVSFFGFNLFKEYKTNLEKSDKKFTELVNDIRTLSFNQEENTAAYAKGIKAAVGDAANYSFIQVRRNNETVVLYPTGKSKEETVSKLTKSFNSSLTVNKQNVSVECNIYLIRPDSIFYFARISFLMILIITIITVIMIIYLNISETSSDVISLEEETDEAKISEEVYDENETASDEIIPDENEEIVSEDDAADNIAAETEATSESVTEETTSATDTSAETEAAVEEEKHVEVTQEEMKAILSEPLTDEQAATAENKEPAKLPIDEVKPDSNEPSGLYNPETGISWESYLSTRLNNEIDRATASEIDLSLFIIQLSEVQKNSEVFKNVCNYLTIQFQFKDLLFEYKEDCIVAIKISMNVDEALKLAEKLYTDICNIINGKNCRIGISSRSIRMVGGDRLILEAEQAIEHSDTSSPVIAFRVDSEKYRQLMEANQ